MYEPLRGMLLPIRHKQSKERHKVSESYTCHRHLINQFVSIIDVQKVKL